MTRMLDLEHFKGISLLIGAVATKFGTSIASTGLPDDLAKWIDGGGTGLAIVLLIMAKRHLRGEIVEERKQRTIIQEKNDVLHKHCMDEQNKSTEARILLAGAIEKLADKIDKK